MRFIVPGAIILALLVVGGAYLTTLRQPAGNSPAYPVITDTAPAQGSANVSGAASAKGSNAVPARAGYTLAQVAQHASAASCWAVINGNVYDLTRWIPMHPGGESPILSICGTDGSAAFNAQHGGQSRPARILAGFKLGALAS